MAFRIEECKCILDRGKSILIESPNLDEPTWIPQSQITDDSEVYGLGHEGFCEVTDWLAQQRGWD